MKNKYTCFHHSGGWKPQIEMFTGSVSSKALLFDSQTLSSLCVFPRPFFCVWNCVLTSSYSDLSDSGPTQMALLYLNYTLLKTFYKLTFWSSPGVRLQCLNLPEWGHNSVCKLSSMIRYHVANGSHRCYLSFCFSSLFLLFMVFFFFRLLHWLIHL